ncbi:flagellar biosynthetic protein FliR [Halodurantibacterium flavum]|uniref:Flagellar biosynthetic protein FliR n=1 Tax=Halodurantibacterium flavum TaxID=1382802 RepID=A0ABW4S7Y0_9RHOB
MNPALSETMAALLGQGQEMLLAGFFVFLRVGAAMATLPVFGEQVVPLRVRLGLTVAFTLVVTPLAWADMGALVAAAEVLTRAIATETIAGLLIGLSLRLFVMVLQIAGTIVAQSISLSQFLGGAGPDPQPAVAQLFFLAGLALAAAADLHVRVAELFLFSYELMPAGQFPGGSTVAEWGIGHIARAFTLAFTLAAPFVIAATIYNLALGAINKAMPQLMVVFVGAPALTLGGLLFLLVITPILLGVWHAAFLRLLADPFTGAG